MIDYNYMILTAIITLLCSGSIFYYWHRRQMIAMRVNFMQRLPMTLEQIDANMELQKAHHLVDICQYELEIAKVREAEAEANAQLHEARNRIDSLNRKLEIFQIQRAASKKIKQVRKIEENLIDLDEAKNSLDKKADKSA